MEIPIESLDARQRKLLENARVALLRADFDYACEATAQVLRSVPGCVGARRLQRIARQRARTAGPEGLLTKFASGVSSASFVFTTAHAEPNALLARADAVLARFPNNVAALKLLAIAAEKLGWRETVVFACEAVRELEPGDRGNLAALAEAQLSAGNAGAALRVADALLREQPGDGAAIDLMRRASVAEAMAKGRWEDGAAGETGERAALSVPPRERNE